MASNPTSTNSTTGDPFHAGLSPRATEIFRNYPSSVVYMTKTKKNKYHPQNNPEGIVAFGLAENKVAVDVLLPKMVEVAKLPEDKKIFSYGDTTGEMDFRNSLKKFLEHNFQPLEELHVDNLIVTNGVTQILENLAFSLASPGEYIMIPKPYYYRLSTDLGERPGVLSLTVDQPLPSDTPDNRYPLDVPALEAAYEKATRQEGKVVRAIHLTNPNNPTGDMYTAQELKDVLDFAHRHHLHVIANELYGMSVCDPEKTFTSILTLPHPDPERVHFLWGFSKDLGLSGIRVSMIYTKNPGLKKYFGQTGIYIRPTALSQYRLKHIIDDCDYINNQALPEIKRRMWVRHQSIKAAIEECGGRVHPSPATVFRWMDLSSFLPSPGDFEAEHQLFLRIYSAGVHLVSGGSLFHSRPGWFRMVAALDEDAHAEGMRRLVALLKSIREEQQQQQQQQQQEQQQEQ